MQQCTLFSAKFRSIPALKFSKEKRGLFAALCVQNTDEGTDRRIFQPPCMKPAYATLGTLSLQHTISHPQSAPAAAWPGFDAVSFKPQPHQPSAAPLPPRCGATLQPQISHLRAETHSQRSSAKGHFPIILPAAPAISCADMEHSDVGTPNPNLFVKSICYREQ